ncbi:MAG: dihydroorotate dehydrogenase-like protein [Acidobacteria bacterium]|nr:dihydroorotate dehydrogenase-like protein [Acidobacteriota bacterium]
MDTKTTYLGLTLPHPFIAGAGPFADSIDNAKRIEDGGASAIVMRSLFEEQIDSEAMATHKAIDNHAESYAEARSYFVEPIEFVVGPDEYLENVRRLKETLRIPVIASLNGYSTGGWLEYAMKIEEAGADALELNVYYVPTEERESGDEIETRTVAMVGDMKKAIRIPVAVKLSAFYTALPNFARRLEVAGADGLVLFNRLFEADIDIEQLAVISQMHLSTSSELLLRLRWLAILSGRLHSTNLAVSGGVHTSIDAIKAVMAGASAIQMVAAIFKNGPTHVGTICREMVSWMDEKGYDSIGQMRGSMNILRSPNPREYERANYLKILQTWEG